MFAGLWVRIFFTWAPLPVLVYFSLWFFSKLVCSEMGKPANTRAGAVHKHTHAHALAVCVLLLSVVCVSANLVPGPPTNFVAQVQTVPNYVQLTWQDPLVRRVCLLVFGCIDVFTCVFLFLFCFI